MEKSQNNKVKTTRALILQAKAKKLAKKQQENVENLSDIKNIMRRGEEEGVKKTKIKIDSENSINITNSSNMALIWNTNGWIRVFLGTDRSDLTCEDPNKMMHVTTESKTGDVVRDMVVPEGYTIWVQIGGSKMRRLRDSECPLMVQEEFLRSIDVTDVSRRARLAIDPDFKYILRFFIGPKESSMCGQATRSGVVEVLKGHVFPQWKKRFVSVIGSQLIVFPGDAAIKADMFNLASADILEHTPTHNRLIIKIVPSGSNGRAAASQEPGGSGEVLGKKSGKVVESTIERAGSGGEGDCTSGNGNRNNNAANNQNGCSSNEFNFYNSHDSVHSTSEKEATVLFFGFEDSWERDLWSNWLQEASVSPTSTPKRMDITNAGLTAIPEVIVGSNEDVEELAADQNQLQGIALSALSRFSNLKVLKLTQNSFQKFPESILNCEKLVSLDLADNIIENVPEGIFKLKSLSSLSLDRNRLTGLPNSLRECKNLKVLKVSHNRLDSLPKFLLSSAMGNKRKKENVNLHRYKIDVTTHETFNSGNKENESEENPPLTNMNLRANHLKGNIILGNYSYLTELDVSENQIQVLDLSALNRLELLQCSKNNVEQLIVSGHSLKSLIAGNNCLKKVTIQPAPQNLTHLDLSYNDLDELPDWILGCHQITTLFLSHNKLSGLPSDFFGLNCRALHTLQLSYNQITSLPPMNQTKLLLRQLFLQSNQIVDLPEAFFAACENLQTLNAASNKLITLPILDTNHFQLEKLFLTNNNLSDRVLDSLVYLVNLRVLHVAYNSLTALPESCIASWVDMEELVISGNRLQHLPDNLIDLKHLRVLRAHSNQLQTVPPLAKVSSLRVIDIAGNHLDKVNLVSLTPRRLQFLDISCNMQLQIDPKQLQACRSQRSMNLVDVSGKNRSLVPNVAAIEEKENGLDTPWSVGFSETIGNNSKLYVAQLRLPNFCSSEGLFGIFDAENNSSLLNTLVKSIPKILLEERTMKETASEYMKYTMLSAHRELKQAGQLQGVSATVCHISRSKLNENNSYYPKSPNGRRFVLRVANVGTAEAMLVRRSSVVRLTKSTPNRRIGCSGSYPVILPNPETFEVTLADSDEFLVVANKNFWEVLSPEAVVEEARKEKSVTLVAKRLQDIAQSYGAEENLSILVVRFNDLGTDIDLLMRELRQTIRKKPIGSGLSGFCKCGCCCETNNNCCHSGAISHFVRQASSRSDRSSPSGQSDNTTAEANSTYFTKSSINSSLPSRKFNNYLANERRSLRSGVARAVRARIEEDEREREETDSAISEEQFKCWEYMLEQNTQLLFDKELDTISKSFAKKPQNNLLQAQLKSLSASSPQIQELSKIGNYNTVGGRSHPFLSKVFGSSRSFHSTASNLHRSQYFKSRMQNIPPGGPNAAYFGSIQRLMPYNLEYDFSNLQSYGITADQLDEAARLHNYWDVATTEL